MKCFILPHLPLSFRVERSPENCRNFMDFSHFSPSSKCYNNQNELKHSLNVKTRFQNRLMLEYLYAWLRIPVVLIEYQHIDQHYDSDPQNLLTKGEDGVIWPPTLSWLETSNENLWACVIVFDIRCNHSQITMCVTWFSYKLMKHVYFAQKRTSA